MNTPHPELEALAELADPAEPTQGADELLAHVETCEQCTADVAALRGVRHSLRSLPPVQMPDDVATRLESALRAAAEVGPEPAGAVSVLPAREQPGIAPRRDRWFPQFSAAAVVAVLVVVALGTGIGVMVSQSGGQTKGSATNSAAGSGASGPVLITSGADYQQATIRNQIAALVLSRVPQAPQQYKGLHALAPDAASAGSVAAGASAPAAAPSAAPATSAASSTGSSPAGSFGAVATPSRSAAAARSAISGPLADPAALQACILALVQKPETPVLVDYANYQGKPATIIVLADPTTPSTLDVYVEADTADCAKSGDVTFVTFLPAAS